MTRVFSIVFFIVTGSRWAFAEGATLDFCKIHEPDAAACLAKNIQNGLRLLKTGVPEYGLDKFDPYPVSELTLDAGKGAVQLVQYYTNITLSGFSDATVQSARFDDKRKSLRLMVRVPELVQQGHYKASGKIMSLPINGEGESKLVLSDTDIAASIQFEPTLKDGQEYFKIKSVVVDIVPQKMTMNFENLFNGNQALADNMIEIINEEWRALYEDVKPSIVRNYADIFKRYAKKCFDKVPANKIFLN